MQGLQAKQVLAILPHRSGNLCSTGSTQAAQRDRQQELEVAVHTLATRLWHVCNIVQGGKADISDWLCTSHMLARRPVDRWASCKHEEVTWKFTSKVRG